MTAVAQSLELPAERAGTRTSPYQGLVPYSEEDADYFFGRNAWRDIIVDHLLAYRVSVLYGASGVGKSSVLHAGVVHRLRAHARCNLKLFGVPESVPVIVSRWSGDPRIALTSGIEHGVAAVSPELAREPPSGSLADVLAAWGERLGGPLAIVLDQFDEYFVYHERDAATSLFATELAEALLHPDVPGNVLVSIREDAVAKLDRFEDRIPGLWQNLLRLEHLDHEAAREAIEKPIARWAEREDEAVELESGVVEAVLAEAGTERVRLDKAGHGVVAATAEEEPESRPVEAPYLQLVMKRLWEEERRRGSRTLHVATLARMGGGDQIVRSHFDAVMRGLPRRRRKVAARMFQYLVTPAGTKIALPASALAKWSRQKERKVTPVLQTLADPEHRILRTVSTPGDQEAATSYEIYHDRLAPGILDWRRRFVRRRRLRRLVALVIAPALVLAALATVGAISERSERLQLQKELRERAKLFEEKRARAVTTARRSQHFGAVVALHSDRVHSAFFRADGERVVTASDDGTVAISSLGGDPKGPERRIEVGLPVRAVFVPGGLLGIETGFSSAEIWDAAGMRFEIPAASWYASLAFTRDGRRVLAAAEDGRAVLWDVGTHRAVRTFGAAQDTLDTATLSEDGAIVVTAGDRSVVWDGATGARIRELATRGRPVVPVVAPDGRTVLTVSPDGALLWPLAGGPPVALAGAAGDLESIGVDLDHVAHFSPGGRVVVAGTPTPTISDRLGRQVAVLRGHADVVTAARFSHDGRRVATASVDRTVRIWDAGTGEALAVLRGHQEDVTSVAFDPGANDRLVTASGDGTVILWQLRLTVD